MTGEADATGILAKPIALVYIDKVIQTTIQKEGALCGQPTNGKIMKFWIPPAGKSWNAGENIF